MKAMDRICLLSAVLGLALALPSPSAAQQAAAGGPGEWLDRYAGARTLGLGSAFVANADDPLGVLWNPAGLSSMNQNELRFENSRLYEGTSINAIGFAVPGSWLPSLGVSVFSLGSGDFQRTNELNDPLGTFHEGETAYLLTASKSISPKLSVGANFKLVQQTIEDFSGGGYGLDLGGNLALTPSLKVGASVMNLGGPSIKLRDTSEPWPTVIRGGASLGLFDGRGMVAAELDQSQGMGTRFHGGAEYWIQRQFALRMGYDDSYATGGFSYRFAPQYQVDYGVADNPLGLTHRVGIAYRFGGFFASSSAEPSVFSPTGEHAVTKISLNARTKAEPQTWSLDILNKSDEVVRRFGGQGQPPSHLQWDGKDENGMPLADGNYRYSLVVHDAAGRVVTGPTHVLEISTGGPQGTVPLVQSQPDNGSPR
jgi:hypothetical protein